MPNLVWTGWVSKPSYLRDSITNKKREKKDKKDYSQNSNNISRLVKGSGKTESMVPFIQNKNHFNVWEKLDWKLGKLKAYSKNTISITGSDSARAPSLAWGTIQGSQMILVKPSLQLGISTPQLLHLTKSLLQIQSTVTVKDFQDLGHILK
jgi:hypothetical protein